MYPKKVKRILGIFLLIAIVILLVWAPELSWTVNGRGKIMASREWIVKRGNDGQVISETIDHLRGGQRSYSVLSLQRGDLFRFDPSDSIAPGTSIPKDTEIGGVLSLEDAYRVEELRGALNEAQALLRVDSSGEKEEVVQAARDYLANRIQQYEAQKIVLQRQRDLFNTGLIPEQEYEYHETLLRLYETEIDIAKAELAQVQSGAKPAQIAYSRQRIDDLKGQLKVLAEKQSGKKLRAPFSGTVAQLFSGDTLLIVRDAQSWVVHVAVPWQEAAMLAVGDSLSISVPGTGMSSKGFVSLIGQESFILAQKSMAVITGTINNGAHLAPGLPVECSIESGKVSLYTWLGRLWNDLM